MSDHDYDEWNRTLGRIEANTQQLLDKTAAQEATLKSHSRCIHLFKGWLAALSTALAGAWAYFTHFHPPK